MSLPHSVSRTLRRWKAVCAIMLVPGLTGCVGMWRTSFDPEPDWPALEPLPPIAEAFEYLPGVARPTVTGLPDTDRDYDKFLLEFPPVGRNGAPPIRLTAQYFRSKTAGPGAKTAIVLPIWGSYRYPSRKVSRTLRRRSRGAMHVIEVSGDEPLFLWEEMASAPTEEAFVEVAGQMTGRVEDMVIAIRELLDWARAGETDVSVVGFSMSAIVAAIVIAVDDRFSRGVLMMGAGNPGKVFATCNGRVADVRDAVLDRFGWSRAQYMDLFQELFEAGDPSRYHGRYRPERLLIIDGVFDGCMAKDTRRALWEATGRQERIRIFGTHRWSFLSLTPFALNIAGKSIHDFIAAGPVVEPETLACTATAC